MKLLLIIATIFLSGIYTPTHDVPIAIFHITESNGLLEINITFDLEDFSKSTDIKTSKINIESMENYLVQNTNFQFNSQVAKLKLSDMQIVRDHIKIKGIFEKSTENISTIRIENTCLINVLRHSNVIQVDLNNESRDYRMHSKRTAIELKY